MTHVSHIEYYLAIPYICGEAIMGLLRGPEPTPHRSEYITDLHFILSLIFSDTLVSLINTLVNQER